MSKARILGSLSVVTGASSGIGAATAQLLAARGSRVVLMARNAARLEEVANTIRARGGEADAFAVDLGDPGALATTASRLIEAHGAPQILINNAGVGRWLPLLETSAEEAAAMMAVPYLAAFNLTRELLPAMLANGSGHVVNITSVAARLAWPGAVAYSVARTAMDGFTRALRADLCGTGISVMLAMFGTVASPYWDHNPGSRERIPKGAEGWKVLSPDEVAEAIVAGLERDARSVIAPAAYTWLIRLERLFPRQIEKSLCRTV